MRTCTVLSIAFMTAAVAPVMGVPTPYRDIPVNELSGEVSRSVNEKNPFLWPSFKNDPNGPLEIPAKREEDIKTGITTVMNDAVQHGLITQDEANSLVQLFTTPEGVQFLQELESDIPAHGTPNHPTSELAGRRIGAGTVLNGLFDSVSTAASLADFFGGSHKGSNARRRIGTGTVLNGLFDSVSTAASLADFFGGSHKSSNARRRIGTGTIVNGLFDSVSTAASLADFFGGSHKGSNARRELADWHGDSNLLPDEVNLLMATREADDISVSRRDSWLHDMLKSAYEAGGGLKRDEVSDLRRDWRDELKYDEIVKSSGEKREMPSFDDSATVESLLQGYQPLRMAKPETNLD
ncbi:hypothetical protein JVU11DRAFT_9545 [Chiua virens]|nr:hypothetical protein JVU11DRAFT_9545 [Chiua virens]